MVKGMSNLSKLTLITIAIFIVSLTLTFPSYSNEAATLSSYDWPTFRGSFERNGFTQSFIPVDNKLIWECPVGYPFRVSPSLADKKIYAVAENGVVYCINLRNGSILWSKDLGEPCNSTPTYYLERLYLTTASGNVHCINSTDGEIIWTTSLGKSLRSTPLIREIDNSILVIVVTKDGWIYVLNGSSNGEVISYKYLGGEVNGSPSARSRRVYIGLEVIDESRCFGRVLCLDALSLRVYWNVTVDDPVQSSISVSNSRIFFSSLRGVIYCMDALTGSQIWNTSLHVVGCYATPAIGYSKVYVPSGNRLYCLNITNGEMMWYIEVNGRVFSSVSLGGNGLGVFVSNESVTYCFDANSGDIKWIFPVPEGPGNFISSPIITNSTIIVAAPNGVVYRIGSKAPPFILSVESSPSPQVYNSSTRIDAIVVDHARGVLNVTLHYWDNVTQQWHVLQMSLAQGDIHNGSWSAEIPKLKYGTYVKYYVNACSVSGLFTVSDMNEFVVLDIYPPEISNISFSPAFPSYESNVTVTATVTEPENSSGIASVTLVYLENSSGGIVVHKCDMVNIGNNKWAGNICPYPWRTYVSFYIVASDDAGNLASSLTYNYTVIDPNPPIIASITIDPPEPKVGDVVKVYATIIDNGSGVQTVTLSYDYIIGHDEVSMSLYMGDIYQGTWEAEIPSDVNNYQVQVKLIITVVDNAGNEAISTQKSYYVGDNIPPKVLRVQIEPPRPQYCDNVTVVAQVVDYESGVSNVFLRYFIMGENAVFVEMNRISENAFIATIPAYPYATHVYYQIIANDVAGNNVTSPVYMYIVEDFTPPEIMSVSYEPPSPLPEEEVKVTVTVSDRGSGVKTVVLKYFEDGTWHELVMQRTSGNQYQGTYVEKIGNLKAGSFVKFVIIVKDYAGNNVTSITYTFTVRSKPLPLTLILGVCLIAVIVIAVIVFILS
ncbi:hypothetical protein DRO02_05675, partial [archaeon]